MFIPSLGSSSAAAAAAATLEVALLRCATLRYENLTRAHKHARVCASWPRVTKNKTKLLNASMCSGRAALTRTSTAATHVFVPTPHSQPAKPRADWPDRSLVTGGVDRRGAGLAVARGCARFARHFVPGGGGRGRERRCSVSVSVWTVGAFTCDHGIT